MSASEFLCKENARVDLCEMLPIHVMILGVQAEYLGHLVYSGNSISFQVLGPPHPPAGPLVCGRDVPLSPVPASFPRLGESPERRGGA